MNLLDDRFVKNTQSDIDYSSIKVIDSGEEYFLEPLESVIVQPSVLPTNSVDVNIRTVEGYYRVILLSTETPNNQSPALLPNGLSYGDVFTDTELLINHDPTTGAWGLFGHCSSHPNMWNDIQNGWDDTGPTLYMMYISTYTNRKVIRAMGGSVGGVVDRTTVWNDTTTPWTKLGIFTPFISTNTFSYFKAHVQRLR